MLEPSNASETENIDISAYDVAWAKLMDRDGFYADYGPSTVERNDPMFLLQKSCCWWSGQSWPYATTQTLKALANLLQSRKTPWVTPEDYVELLHIYAKSHRKEGRPYLAEALHPDTGSFEGHDGYNHSEHYFHSGFCDLVITGLIGIQPTTANSKTKNSIEIRPLAPSSWDYFALDGLMIQGREVSVAWDRTGSHYGKGQGLRIYIDGKLAKESKALEPIVVEFPTRIESAARVAEAASKESSDKATRMVNHLVGNDGLYFPRITASSTMTGTSIAKLHDGNYWYLQHPPNRWESASSDEVQIDIELGTPRTLESLQILLLDDTQSLSKETVKPNSVALPQSITLTTMSSGQWGKPIAMEQSQLRGHSPTRFNFTGGVSGDLSGIPIERIRIQLKPQSGMRVGITEIEGWGKASVPYEVAPPPTGNLAYRPSGAEFPKATASHSDRFGGTPEKSNDGKTVFNPNPVNRWTSYESTREEDWLELDLGKATSFNRIELAIYDDRGGVQAPESYAVEYWGDEKWERAEEAIYRPEKPAGSQWNEVRFKPVSSSKVRILFKHKLPAKSGVTEVMLWNDHLSPSSR
jgi:hypothetical protein